jgi:uncharacterized phage protein (TIGR01671 family)|nr:MAG TPA: YopX protein [Caudoviricetes sp.]
MIPRYRAWDKNLKTMYEVDGIMSIDFGESEICVKTLFFEQTNRYNFDDIVLMQSTGLRDKNGKEIFEGDILEVNDWLEVVSFSEEKAMFVSKGIGFPETSLYDLLDSDIFTVEIIGNIYENPELLEVEQ